MASARLANVERLRILALLDVIGFHLGAGEVGAILGGMGLFVFLVIGAIFNVSVARARGLAAFARDKLARLIVPWLFWSGVYGLLLAWDGHRIDGDWRARFEPWMILTGPRIFLWFVPFAAASGVFTAWLYFATRRWRDEAVVIAASIVGVMVLLLASTLLRDPELPRPIPQYLLGASTPLLGFALARALFPSSPEARARLFPALVGALAVLALVLLLVDAPRQSYKACGAALAVALACAWPGPQGRLTTWATPLLFGVYLSHQLVIRVAGPASAWTPLVSGRNLQVILHSGVVLVGALGLTWLLRRTPVRRFL
jgi:hypothetical protein